MRFSTATWNEPGQSVAPAPCDPTHFGMSDGALRQAARPSLSCRGEASPDDAYFFALLLRLRCPADAAGAGIVGALGELPSA